jgi:hypothetical protein
MIALFLDFLEAYHTDCLDAAMAQELRDGRIVTRTVLIAYDAAARRLRVVDPIPKRDKGA